jgi:transposase
MYTVELYARVRRAVLVEGKSRRAVAREFGLARKTIGKMLEYSLPPGYRRQKPVRRPKLGPWQGVIDAILEEDKQRPKKQRHTAKRIFERLRAEYQYTGGYTIVKDYVRAAKIGGQEMFVPLSHAPGEAQADFGEAVVVIAGVECKAHFMAFDLPHSDDCFVQAFPAETTEAFLEGHVRAFEYFGAVPTRILYDNTTLAVARILGNGERQKTRAFSELQSYYLFAEKFGRPGKGNDKGKVENLVGYSRRNFMVPIPQATSWEALTLSLQPIAECAARVVCAATRRLSQSASNATAQRCCRFRLHPTKPARRSPCGSVRSRWCAIAPTTTRFRLSSDIVRSWSRAMCIVWRLSAAPKLSPAMNAVMNARPRSTIHCTIWPCLNTRAVHSIRPLRWRDGSCLSVSPTYGACSKHG